MPNEQPNLTDEAKSLLRSLPRRVPCYKRDYRVSLCLSDMGLVTVTEPERRGNIVSYLVAPACQTCGGYGRISVRIKNEAGEDDDQEERCSCAKGA